MYDEINYQLEVAQQGVLRMQKIDSMLNELKQQKKSVTEKVTKLKLILDKEDIDVEKLEGKSLAHIFHSILGNLDENLAKERQEALAAQLKHDQAVRDLDNINSEISKLIAERERYNDCEVKYQELYARKKELLLQANSLTAEQILQLTNQITLINNHRKELREAVNAGLNVMEHLNSAEDSLDSAEGWGTWDLLGGGLLSDMAKHSHIDDAKAEVENIQAALSKFRTELADVRISSNINIEIDGFEKFADFFFDGLFADWNMQSRINESQESVRNTKEEVQRVIDKLNRLEREENNQVEQLEGEVSRFIIQAQ